MNLPAKTRRIDEAFTEKRDGQGRSVDQLKHVDDFLCIKNIESIMKDGGNEQETLFGAGRRVGYGHRAVSLPQAIGSSNSFNKM